MNCCLKRFYFLLLIIVFVSVVPSIVSAVSSNQPYVDLDGDGINDNIDDIDNNNIPDSFQSKIKLGSGSSLGQFKGFSSTQELEQSAYKNLNFSQSFSLNKFSARSLDKCRYDSESGFGIKVGFGSSGGGACAGGVCF